MARGRFVSKAISLDEKVERHSIPVALLVEVIERDQCTCQYCGKWGELTNRYARPAVVENPTGRWLPVFGSYNGDDVVAFHIDHIIPISKGGENIKKTG